MFRFHSNTQLGLSANWLFRAGWAAAVALPIVATCLADNVHASSFGSSFNINFGAESPVRGGAGLFGDSVWTEARDNAGRPLPIIVDQNGDPTQTRAFVSWEAAGIEKARGINGGSRGDMAMMGSYLAAPTKIELLNLHQIVSVPRGQELNYTLILYTHSGQAGQSGKYTVNDQSKEHIELDEFNGRYIDGIRGNMVVFPNLNDPNLVITTDGTGPVNAISMVYCLAGDFNRDGQIDVTDLATLSEAVKEGGADSSLDVNFDGVVNSDDVMSWIKCSKGTCVGDVNLDGSFDSSDLINLFAEGIYDTDSEATWMTGDWNGDCKFDSGDLLLAFQEGCYEGNQQLAQFLAGNNESRHTVEELASMSDAATKAMAVPEPTSLAHAILLTLMAGSGFLRRRRSDP